MKVKLNHVCSASKQDLSKKGVYKISFGQKECYVGSTSASFKKRLSNHISRLNCQKHANKYLQRVFNKYKENMKVDILEIVEEVDKILSREQHWIDYYDCYKNGYNTVPLASNTLGFKMYEHVLDKRRKKFLQYDLDGKFIKEWNSYTKIIKEIGGLNFYILDSSNYQGHGFLWRRRESENYPLQIEPYTPVDRCYKIASYHLEGNLYKTYPSILEASKIENINHGNISKVLNKENKKAFGLMWKSYSETPIIKIKPYIEKTGNQAPLEVEFLNTGKKQIFKSAREVQKQLGITRANFMKKLGKIVRKDITGEKFIVRKLTQ